MPTFPEYPGFHVEIFARDGPKYVEYPDPDMVHGSNHVMCYIEVTAGTEFEIRYKFDSQFPADLEVCAYTCVDRQFIRNHVFSRTFIEGNIEGNSEWSLKGQEYNEGDQWFVQWFKFTDLSADDGDNKYPTPWLGTILVQLRPGTTQTDQPVGPWSANLNEQRPVSEKELKGQSKSLQVGPGTVTKIPAIRTCRWQEHEKGARAMYEIKYRSRKELEDLGVITSGEDPDVKGNIDVKNGSDVKSEPKIKKEPDTDDDIVPPSPYKSITQDDRTHDLITSSGSAKTYEHTETEPKIKREPGSDDDLLQVSQIPSDLTQSNISHDSTQREMTSQDDTPQGEHASASGEPSVPAKRAVEDTKNDELPEKKIKQEEAHK